MVRDSVEGTSTSSYYTILGIPIDSSPHDIRHAYRKLAMVIELLEQNFWFCLVSFFFYKL